MTARRDKYGCDRRMDDETEARLAIKLSHTTALLPCALCGGLTEALSGPDLFLADTDNLVWWECGRKLAPALLRMLGMYWRGRAEAREWLTSSA